MLNPRLDQLTDYPFKRLAELLGEPPGPSSIIMSIGEPQHQPPAFLAEILHRHAADWGKYPPANGTLAFRQAVQAWLTRRFDLSPQLVDAETNILPVAGTREALYMVGQLTPSEKNGFQALALLPNPFYQVYQGAAVMAGAKPVFVAGANDPTAQPDYQTLSPEILDRVTIATLCSPANPQGSVASLELLKRSIQLARKHDFILCVDECYSEIWDREQPSGALTACDQLGEGLRNVLVFHSLSKRSSVPGLRSGFVAGDDALIQKFALIRSYGGAALPLPIIHASTALWQDEAHVEVSRILYRQKMDMAERFFGQTSGFRRPEGGFFLWLTVEDGEKAALALWKEAGIRVLPGAYLARTGEDGINPGKAYIRVALVHDLATTERALSRISPILFG
jgi:N-succinyldiaminopimelate aminotransferase